MAGTKTAPTMTHVDARTGSVRKDAARGRLTEGFMAGKPNGYGHEGVPVLSPPLCVWQACARAMLILLLCIVPV